MARKLLFLLPVALFAVLVIAFAVGLRHDPHLLPSALIDRPAPDFALPGLYESANGLTRNDLDGRVTLVNFFASWCAPCREEHSELMALGRLPGVTLDGIAYKDKPEEFAPLSGPPRQPLRPYRGRPQRHDRDRFWGLRRAGDLCRGRHRPYPLSPRRSLDRRGCQKRDPAADPATRSGRIARPGSQSSELSVFAGDLGEKAGKITPTVGDGLDRRAADCDRLSAHLVGAEPLIKEPRRIFAQHPKDRRPPPCGDEPAEQRDQQPSPDPLVLPIRGDVKGEHFTGEGAVPAMGPQLPKPRMAPFDPTATRTSRGSRRITPRHPASRRRSDNPTR